MQLPARSGSIGELEDSMSSSGAPSISVGFDALVLATEEKSPASIRIPTQAAPKPSSVPATTIKTPSFITVRGHLSVGHRGPCECQSRGLAAGTDGVKALAG